MKYKPGDIIEIQDKGYFPEYFKAMVVKSDHNSFTVRFVTKPRREMLAFDRNEPYVISNMSYYSDHSKLLMSTQIGKLL